jgi:hypothetical protein
VRPVLTEIYLCHACSCQEILRVETPRGRQGGEEDGDDALAKVGRGRWASWLRPCVVGLGAGACRARIPQRETAE